MRTSPSYFSFSFNKQLCIIKIMHKHSAALTGGIINKRQKQAQNQHHVHYVSTQRAVNIVTSYRQQTSFHWDKIFLGCIKCTRCRLLKPMIAGVCQAVMQLRCVHTAEWDTVPSWAGDTREPHAHCIRQETWSVIPDGEGRGFSVTFTKSLWPICYLYFSLCNDAVHSL